MLPSLFSQSIAREWNEEVLEAIRNDFARPTVHARNLFHSSVLMYDVWALFDDHAETFFLGKQWGHYTNNFEGFSTDNSISEAQRQAISYAVYRLMQHRFQNAPSNEEIFESIDEKMQELGYDVTFSSIDYQSGNPAALGNYMAEEMIAFGMQDGANEADDYINRFYEPINPVLNTDFSGNSTIIDPNRWQPLRIENFVDQSGNSIPGGTPEFLSPEWGSVLPFALKDEDKSTYERDGFEYEVYHDPGDPWYIENGLGIDDAYKWGFAMVSVWGSHLSPSDEVLIDISPRSIGNISFEALPETFVEFQEFYSYFEGGDPSPGREFNPITGQPYESQMVFRGDYTRVLAEFWADGPDSETPPGHWFTILNYVSDQPDIVKKIEGRGSIVSDLEWDVKTYFALGGAMHDAAIAAWGCKGYYDYVRPMSAIRYMGDMGQSSDMNLPNYNPHGLPLIPGYIELVTEDDPLVGPFLGNLNKLKLYTWKGPDFIVDPILDEAGVDWILAEDWFPYQRPSFVTPPFAGYVSGHSTFSRAAAVVLTAITGSEYFPGGIGVFDIEADEFLVFEDGPSRSMQLQWATYTDASDQTSLSRIWGGIHPPIDDIPGRKMGGVIGEDAVNLALSYFTGALSEEGIMFPNPMDEKVTLLYKTETSTSMQVIDIYGRILIEIPVTFDDANRFEFSVASLLTGNYVARLIDTNRNVLFQQKLIKK